MATLVVNYDVGTRCVLRNLDGTVTVVPGECVSAVPKIDLADVKIICVEDHYCGKIKHEDLKDIQNKKIEFFVCKDAYQKRMKELGLVEDDKNVLIPVGDSDVIKREPI